VQINKILQQIILSFSFLVLVGCGSTVTKKDLDFRNLTPKLSASHEALAKEVMQSKTQCRPAGTGRTDLVCTKRRLPANRMAKKKNSIEGKWLITVNTSEFKLKPGYRIKVFSTNLQTGKLEAGKQIDLGKLKTGALIFGTYASVEPARKSGYIVLPAELNAKYAFEKPELSEASQSWTAKGIKFSSKYDPSVDVIYGTVEHPAFGGTFRASRLSEAAFKRLSAPGIFHPLMPMYFFEKI
jgi:hypothetical protein